MRASCSVWPTGSGSRTISNALEIIAPIFVSASSSTWKEREASDRRGMTILKDDLLEALTTPLVLAPNAAINLQLHTTYSDGTWTPSQLMVMAHLSRIARSVL